MGDPTVAPQTAARDVPDDVPGRRCIDLSMPVSPGMPTNEPDHFPPVLTPYSSLDTAGWAGTEIRIDSHCGTHLDAPSHFVRGGATVDQVPLDVLIGPCQVVRVPATGPDMEITPADLPALRSPRVIVHSGWSDRLAADEDGYFHHHSYLGGEAARHLVQSGVRLVGIDGPSVDLHGDVAHQTLLGNDVVIVENLTNTGILPEDVQIMVAPLRIVGGDGSPVRVVAVVEDR